VNYYDQFAQQSQVHVLKNHLLHRKADELAGDVMNTQILSRLLWAGLPNKR
jgi:hypothetical protein